MTPRLRNLAAFAGIVGAFLALGWAVDVYPALARDPRWALLALPAGGGAYLAFGGDFWTRSGLASLAPAVALPLSEAAFGARAAFPGFSLALGAAAAVLFFLGCLLAAGPALLLRRGRHRPTAGADE